MEKEKYYSPKYATGQFHCPHCHVYAKQFWSHIRAGCFWNDTFVGSNISDFNEILNEKWNISKCEHCGDKIIWLDENIIYPKQIIVENPNEDLAKNIQVDYMEAAKIFNDSPRAAAALLRLALQKLCKQLGEKGKNINDDIKNLVRKGLNSQIQKSLDILRINGNNAVHPGEINFEENPEIVLKLFALLNFISEKMITEPKEVDNFYNNLPENSREAIEKRDLDKKL